jgi:hypothetical protein
MLALSRLPSREQTCVHLCLWRSPQLLLHSSCTTVVDIWGDSCPTRAMRTEESIRARRWLDTDGVDAMRFFRNVSMAAPVSPW